jgi:hypothetical protein
VNVPVVLVSSNRGAKLPAEPGAAALHLRGLKDSWRTPPAAGLETFDTFWAVLRRHLLACHLFRRPA